MEKKVAGNQTQQKVIYATKHLKGKIQMEHNEKYEMERMAGQKCRDACLSCDK